MRDTEKDLENRQSKEIKQDFKALEDRYYHVVKEAEKHKANVESYKENNIRVWT